MHVIRRGPHFLAVSFASCLVWAAPAFSASLDENIATSYTALGTSINWQTAGVTSQSC